MSKTIPSILAAAALTWGSTALAEQDTVEAVLNSCKPEIEKYCSQVTLGEGRLLACFYAHEDKLSAACGYALYQAANALEQIVVAFKYVATACEADITELCANVPPGQGRILGCLGDRSDRISEACGKALADVGVQRQPVAGASAEM